MRKNNLWVLAAALTSCLMTFSACSDDDIVIIDDDPVTLSKVTCQIFDEGTGEVVSDITLDYTWEDGLLKQKHSENHFKVGPIEGTSILDEYLTYEGRRCVEMKSVGKVGEPKTITYFYDASGRLTGGIEKTSSDESIVTITSYTADGHIQQIERVSNYSSGTQYKRRYDLTWKNGNIVKYTNHYIEPAMDDETVEVAYDNYPSPNRGTPVAAYIFGEPYQMCSQISKNNPLREGDEYSYENGRVVQIKTPTTVTNYFYNNQ